jgi:tetratricopeptide (TPR) repeat protein
MTVQPKLGDASWRSAEVLFRDAVAMEADKREEFLSESCAEQPETLARVRELLRAYERSADFLEPPSEALASEQANVSDDITARRRIRGFQTIRVIASGGMGTIYEAIQDEPRRTVALKVLGWGGSGSSMRRFRQEVEFLAHLRHAGIAQIYEAGTFDEETGPTPYFAMEYIPEGKSIVDFANDADLNDHERLRLFAEVCDAVYHGHQRGVIHRDLKPGNILVDATGRPKVIDFGVARATDLDLTITTGPTTFGQLVGTPAYMSPEQCAGDPHRIDTRSDVYSLGVVLYELLCGALPHRVSGKSLPETILIIQQDPPRRPSVIRPALRGDLETILLKALAKEPEGRFSSVAELANDIRRYLRHEPIEARPPSSTYQLRLFVRRHRALVTATLSIVLALVAAAGVSITYAIQASAAAAGEAEARAESEVVNQFLEAMLVSLDARRRNRPVITVHQMLDEAAKRVDAELGAFPKLEADVRTQLGLAYQTLGLYDKARHHLQKALELRERSLGREHPDTILSRGAMGTLAIDTGDVGEAYGLLSEYVDTFEQRGDTENPEYVHGLNRLAVSLLKLRRYAEARPVCDKALDLARHLHGDQHQDTVRCLLTWAWVRWELGEYDTAEKAIRTALAVSRDFLDGESLAKATATHSLACMLCFKGNPSAAKELFLEALAIERKLFGDTHPRVARLLTNLAHTLDDLGDYDGAIERMKEALEIRRRLFGVGHPAVACSLAGLGTVLQQHGDYAGAEAAFRESLSIRMKMCGPDCPSTAETMSYLSAVLTVVGEYEEAEALATQAITVLRNTLGTQHPSRNAAVENLATIKLRTRDLSGAEELLLDVLNKERQAFDESHPRVLRVLGNLAALHHAKGELEEAETCLRDLLERASETFDDRHSYVLGRRSDLADAVRDQGRTAEALAIYRDVAATQRVVLPAGHPDLARTLVGMAVALTRSGKYTEAEAFAREGNDIRRRTLPFEHTDTAEAATVLAHSLVKQNKLAESEALLLAAYPTLLDKLGVEADMTQSALMDLVELYEALGRQQKADEYRALLIENRTPRAAPERLPAHG